MHSRAALVQVAQRLEHRERVGEEAIGEQEGVEEVDAEKAQIGETLDELLGRRLADLRHLARVQVLRVLDVLLVLEQLRIAAIIFKSMNTNLSVLIAINVEFDNRK